MPAPTPRTTPALVEGIIQTSPNVDLTPFIAIANNLTTNVCGNSGYSDGYVGSTMELIERWLSAHFYTIYDNQLSMAKAGTVAVGFQYKVDYGLKNSMYGQQVLILDTAANLAKLTNSADVKRNIKVSVAWLGTDRNRGYWGDLWGQLTDLTVEQ
jgi:hypothetical protein